MNILQRIAVKALGLEQKASAAGSTIVATQVGQPIWTPRNYQDFADEGYMRNAIAYRCIAMIAQSAAFVKLNLMNKKSKTLLDDPDHPLLKLLRYPSPTICGNELIEGTLTFLQIAGNAYMEQVGPSGKPPRELYYLRPDRMKVIAGRDAIPAGYDYEANGHKTHWDVDPITGFSPILHLKLFHPLNDWYGLSAMEPAAYAIDRHNEAGAHNMAVLQNGAVPSGALVLKPVTVNGQVQSAPQPIVDAAEARLREQYTGAKNAGKPFVLGGNAEWEQFGFSMEELQLIESKADAARDICIAKGVPHILIIPGQSTYNNMREAKADLYEETVLPRLQWFLDHLNNWLVPQFGDNLRLEPDVDSISALSMRREENRKTYVELHKEKIVTRTEAREALDFDELEGLSDFAPQSHEVTAIVSLINSSKLSKETGWQVLQMWGLLPEDFNPKKEQTLLDEQAENDMANGLMGTEEEEEPVAGKPPAQKPQAVPKAA